jgi:hypothetical protein
MSGLDELLSETDVTPTPEAETPPAEVVAPEPQAAPQEPAQSEAAPVEAQPAALSEPQPERDRDLAGLIKALQDEREQKRAAREEAARLKAERDEQERKRREAQAPNVLDDPEGYHAWVEQQFGRLNQGFQRRIEAARLVDRLEYSEDKWRDKLGDEEFDKIFAWVGKAPENFKRHCEQSRDPYGVAVKEYKRQQDQRRAQELLTQTGGKSVEEIVAERLAAERAKWEAEHGGGQPQPQAARPADARQRNADGTFAPTPEPQRHRPKSLADLNGAAIAAQSAPGSALDGLFGD